MGEDAHLFFFTEWFLQMQRPAGQVGIAVSGGSDSLALLHIMAAAAPHLGISIKAATVDHDLRDGSAKEARAVGEICQSLGIEHETLLWRHGEISGNLQSQASQARYDLLATWAERHDIGDVLIGHTADDQAETFLMGLSRKAGLDGLSGMRPSWLERGVRFSRPLLDKTRDDLRKFLNRRGIVWMDDPSNDNDRFMRVKARRVLKALKPLGITAAKLAAVTDNLDFARSALTHQVAQAAQAVETTAGRVQLNRAELMAQPFEIQRRLLIAALRWIAGGVYPPRETALNGLQLAVLKSKGATLAGCRMRCIGECVYFFREPHAVAGIECPTTELWDNRWEISGPHARDLTIRALGAEGLRAVKDWRLSGISRDALIVSPGVWRNSTLIAAPIAGFSNGWAAKPHCSFASFILSH